MSPRRRKRPEELSPELSSPQESFSQYSERIRSLAVSVYALLNDYVFLWLVQAVIDEPQKPFPLGVYRQDAAMFLLTPLLTSCILKVWILAFDDAKGSLHLIRIAQQVLNRGNAGLGDLLETKIRESVADRPVVQWSSELTDCTRFLRRFEQHFRFDRNSFGAHLAELAAGNRPDPVARAFGRAAVTEDNI